jgi:hypothetical protein
MHFDLKHTLIRQKNSSTVNFVQHSNRSECKAGRITLKLIYFSGKLKFPEKNLR